MYSLKTHSKRLNVTGIEELAGAEEAEEMSKKLGDHLVRGGCAEEGEGTAQLCKAGSVVAAGTLQRGGCSPTEKTPERELTHGCKPGTQVAAQARRCLYTGRGAGELDPVAAAVRLQCAMRGVAARQGIHSNAFHRIPHAFGCIQVNTRAVNVDEMHMNAHECITNVLVCCLRHLGHPCPACRIVQNAHECIFTTMHHMRNATECIGMHLSP